jgi:DNA-binding response OmpR family regulator
MTGGVAEPSGRVVIVDDEERVANVYETFLEDEYDTVTAYGGERALELVDDDVDVVLLDRRMPEMHGDEVLRTLRERGYEGRVVMLTALDPDFEIVDMDFEQYVCKPISQDELRTIVRQELLRANYDETLQDYLSLQSKVNAIDANDTTDVADTEAKAADLRERLDALRDELLDTLVEHARVEYENGDHVDPEPAEDF